VSETAAKKLIGVSMRAYTERQERAAMRCAMGDAAALCDAIAREMAARSRGRGGKGAVTKQGLILEAVAKRCADAIWAMREMIDVPSASAPTEEPK
jgi:hypothetical protein